MDRDHPSLARAGGLAALAALAALLAAAGAAPAGGDHGYCSGTTTCTFDCSPFGVLGIRIQGDPGSLVEGRAECPGDVLPCTGVGSCWAQRDSLGSGEGRCVLKLGVFIECWKGPAS